MARSWIAERTRHFDSSGIRKVFDLAGRLKNPINLSIGQPDFSVPEPIQEAAIDAIRHDRNGYTLTQGIPQLREALQARVDADFSHSDRQVFVTSGTSGALVLAMLVLVDPGDEVIVFDPYFVMYPSLIGMVGGRAVAVDTYPDFRIDVDRVRAAITPRTKMILFNSPANPTGATAGEAEVRALAGLAAEHELVLISDEIYSRFCYDSSYVSAARFHPRTLVIDGFSKTYGITGWRLGYAHGPSEIISQMIKLQQYTYVCAPQPAQWAGIAALEVNMSAQVADYRRKRDWLVESLSEDYEIVPPGGAFYLFPRAPWGTASQFVTRAIERELLIIPGNIFSRHDSHFRVSYAAADAVLERGIDVLKQLARQAP